MKTSFISPFKISTAILISILVLCCQFDTVGQTNTSATGNWNTGANWSAGVPGGGTDANINHAMTVDVNIASTSGDYIINQSITDLAGGTAYTLDVSGTGGNQGIIDFKATSTFEGALNVNSNGTLIVRSGFTLTVGAAVFANNSTVLVETGATLIINGDLTNNNNSTGITINGALVVNGNVGGGNGSAIVGTGTLNASGTIITTGSGSVFGSTGDCSTGPCSGSNLCVVNTIASSQTICSGATPSALTGNAIAGYTYQWQISTTSATAGFANVSGATSQNYSLAALTTTTWYRRIAIGSGCTAYSVAVQITVNINRWTGATSTDWNTASNWCNGIVPTSTSDVTIPAGVTNMPLVSTSANIRNITIAASATLSNTGTLNIYGNVSNSGIISDKGTSVFLGSSAQTYAGTTTDSLNNMTLNNAAGLSITTPLYVKRYLTLSNGDLASAGNLTVNIYTGSILGSGSGTISGNIKVVRTIWKDNWHYISSPLSGKTAADWNATVPIKFGTYANLYTYDETNPSTTNTVGWTAVTTTATAITSMKGFALYFPRFQYQTNFSMTGAYTHSQTYSNAGLTNTASGVPAADGWNLVGNPYPSEIDWNAAGWTKTGLDNATYVWDQANSRYATFVSGIGTNGGSRYIPCMQAFYVKVSNPGTGTLSMTNSVRSAVVNRDNWRVASEDNILKLSATTGAFKDETYIRLSDDATAKFDSQLDAYKLANGGSNPSLSTKLSGLDYAVNSIPSNTIESTVIPVKLLPAITGNYTLTAEITGFADAESITLVDTLLHTTQDLKINPTYSYDLVKGDTLTRLFITYKKKVRQDVVTANQNNTNTNNTASIFAFKQNITVNFNDLNVAVANVAVFDAIGNNVYELKNANTSSGKIEMNLINANNGVYIVKVASSVGVTTQQVYIAR